MKNERRYCTRKSENVILKINSDLGPEVTVCESSDADCDTAGCKFSLTHSMAAYLGGAMMLGDRTTGKNFTRLCKPQSTSADTGSPLPKEEHTVPKVPCTKCGTMILPTTAQNNGGLCMRCKLSSRVSKVTDDNSSKCFVATVCYGTADAPEVLELRRFRDQVLLPSKLGHIAVDLYYRWSPRIADWLRRYPVAREAVRRCLLRPIVGIVSKR